MYELKIYIGRGGGGGGYLSDAKLDKELTCHFRIDMRTLLEFLPKHSKISKICTLMGCLWPKYVMLELRKEQRSYVWWHWIMMQSLKENWFVLSKMTWGIWEIFTRALESLEIDTLMGFFYPKLENVWA